MDPIICSFNGGEVDPESEGRVDIEKYSSSCIKLENFIIKPIGSAFRRPGTYLAAAAKSDSTLSRTVGFVFSSQQAYNLEFANGCIRFFKDGGQIVVSADEAEAYDPSELVIAGVYRKTGNYITRDCGGGKILTIAAPYGLTTTGVTVAVVSAGVDNMSVSAVGTAITINLANGTPAKNAANLIQIALNAATVGTIDMTEWTVTENDAYTASRPTAGVNVVGAALTTHQKIYQSLLMQYSTSFNGAEFVTNTTYWDEVSEGDIVEIVSPYTTAQLMSVKFSQDDNTLYLTHPSHPIYALTRTSHINWELYYHVPAKYTSTSITGATQSNPCQITSAGHGMSTGDIVFISVVEGMVEINERFFKITKIDDNTYNLDDEDSTAHTAYTSGGLSQPTWFGTEDECPSFVGFYEQRMIVGATNSEPQATWSSKSATPGNMIIGSSDDNAFKYTIKSYTNDKIEWMLAMDAVYFGSVSGIWRFGSTTSGEPVTPTNVSAKKLLSYGCGSVEAVIANDVAVFVTRGGLNLREIVYSLAEDKMVSNDLTLIASHITKGETAALSGIVDIDVQQEPLPIIWCVRADGQLLGLLYERSQKIFGWFRVVTDGEVESVAVLPDSGSEDEVWISVKRTVNGATKRYIEYFKPIEFWGQKKDYFGVDCGITFDGGAAIDITNITQANPAVVSAAGHSFSNGDKVRIVGVVGMTEVNQTAAHAYTVANAVAGVSVELSGIDSTGWTAYTSGGTIQKVAKDLSGIHLVGETVDILVDGNVHPQKVVAAAGTVSLSWYGNLIHLGLPFTSTLIPNKIEAQTSSGSTKGRVKRIKEIIMGFRNTIHAWVGRTETIKDEIAFGTGSDIELFSGAKRIPFRGDTELDAQVVVIQDKPLPITVTYMAVNMEVDN